MNKTWSEAFFEGCDCVPGLRNDWTRDSDSPQVFVYEKLKLCKLLIQRPPECPIRVWSAIALREGRKDRFIVKTFQIYTEEDAKFQLSLIRSDLHGWKDVQTDADPFLLEQRAFERISRFCPERRKSFFPRYHGTVALNRQHYPYGYSAFPQGIVMEALRSDLASRWLLSEEVPKYLEKDVERMQERLKDLKLPAFETRWYQSLFVDRLRILTALHALAITHGDIKEEYFRLPNEFHDVGLFDFSRSYTYTPRLPYTTNASRPRTLKRAIEIERSHVQELIISRATKREFRNYILESFQLDQDAAGDILERPSETDSDEGLELIVLKVSTQPECYSFPSLSSILPFLESVCPDKASPWALRRARILDCYRAVWLKCRHRRSSDALTEVTTLLSPSCSSSGEQVLETNPAKSGSSTRQEDGIKVTYYLLLFPKFWIEDNSKLPDICSWIISSSSSKSGNEAGWIVTEDEFQDRIGKIGDRLG